MNGKQLSQIGDGRGWGGRARIERSIHAPLARPNNSDSEEEVGGVDGSSPSDRMGRLTSQIGHGQGWGGQTIARRGTRASVARQNIREDDDGGDGGVHHDDIESRCRSTSQVRQSQGWGRSLSMKSYYGNGR